MAETLVKEKVCNSCGAEVRPNAGFCYNCGSAVAPEVSHSGNKTQKLSDSWFKNDLVEDKPNEIVLKKSENEIIETKVEIQPEEISESEIIEEVTTDDEPEKRDLSKMDSAAKLRRRGKSLQKKRVEIVWEEHDNAPNGWFIFIAILLAALAVGIWFIAKSLE
jgi:hypothetical protein